MQATRALTHPPARPAATEWNGWPERPDRRTFYRHGGVVVTDRWFTVSGRRYAVSGLRNLRTARGPADARLLITTIVALALLAAIVFLTAAADDITLRISSALIAMLPVGAALAAWRMRRQHFSLWADYQGETVEVFGTFDERQYNQVCRALLRAREYDAGYLA